MDNNVSYRRYLIDSDYLVLTSAAHLRQLVAGVPERLAMAEKMAENKVVDYLDQFYEVKQELEAGKEWEEGDDPRNGNLVMYMTMMSIYYLHAIISPTNISETRKEMYREALQWLYDASKLRIDPHIKRRINPKTKKPKDDWTIAAYETNLDTIMKNPWVI